MEGMQTNEGIVGCAEQVGLNGKAFVVDQVVPLASGASEKSRSKSERKRTTIVRRCRLLRALVM